MNNNNNNTVYGFIKQAAVPAGKAGVRIIKNLAGLARQARHVAPNLRINNIAPRERLSTAMNVLQNNPKSLQEYRRAMRMLGKLKSQRVGDYATHSVNGNSYYDRL